MIAFIKLEDVFTYETSQNKIQDLILTNKTTQEKLLLKKQIYWMFHFVKGVPKKKSIL